MLGLCGGHQLIGLAFGAEDELRAREYALQRHLDAAIEVALLTAGPIETHYALDVVIGSLSAIGAPREGGEDLSRAFFFSTRRRLAREDAAPARHVAGTS